MKKSGKVLLYNSSGLPDKPLKKLLEIARVLTECTGDNIVKVTRGGQHANCFQKTAWRVRESFLDPKRGSNTKWISTSGGYIVLSPLTCMRSHGDKHTPGRWLFEVMIHEFCHQREEQLGGRSKFEFSKEVRVKGTAYKAQHTRRVEHGYRPEEIRVKGKTRLLLFRLTHDNTKRGQKMLDTINALCNELTDAMFATWYTTEEALRKLKHMEENFPRLNYVLE